MLTKILPLPVNQRTVDARVYLELRFFFFFFFPPLGSMGRITAGILHYILRASGAVIFVGTKE